MARDAARLTFGMGRNVPAQSIHPFSVQEDIMNDAAESPNIWKWLGGMGVVFSILFVVANVFLGSTPNVNASPIKIVDYFHSHKGSVIAGVFVVAFAALAFAFFLAALRRALSNSNVDSSHVSAAILIGGAVYLGGLLLMCVLDVGLTDAAHYHLQGAAQTLNVLQNDAWVPVVVGLSIVALSTGIASLRGHALPRWLGWASIALGILAVSGPLGAIAFLLAPLWTLAVGVVLIRRSSLTPDSVGNRTAGRPAMAG
jgi:hypothetical protein